MVKQYSPINIELSRNKIFLIILIVGITVFVLGNANPSFAVQYSNHTSDKYQIQFQYPTDWQLEEKTSRFEEGSDIAITSPTFDQLITIGKMNTSEFGGMGLRETVYDYYKSSISNYDKETRSIEVPSFSTIDNQESGTYLITTKDKFKENAIKWAQQYWLVKTSNGGYLMTYMATTDIFDSPDSTERRNNFIKSIKFLGLGNSTQSSQPSRFD